MIRLYLDSNVIKNIQNGILTDFKSFINLNRERFLIPFSQAHISDKISSKDKMPEKFWEDLEFIEKLTQKQFLYFSNKNLNTIPCIANTKYVLNQIEENYEIINEFSNVDKLFDFILDNLKEYGMDELAFVIKESIEQPLFFDYETNVSENYKQTLQKSADYFHSLLNNFEVYKNQRSIIQNEFKLTINSGNWNKNVIDQIDKHLYQIGKDVSFFKLVEQTFENDVSKMNRFSFFIQAYQYLNLIGYKPDKVKKSGVKNHIYDAIHSFYAAHCDYLITSDENLIAKTKALYEKMNINTKVLKPNEFINEFTILYSDSKISDLVANAMINLPIDQFEHKKLFRLNQYFLGYFTHLQIETNKIIFTKITLNYSDFLFNKEFEGIVLTFLTFLNMQNNYNTVLNDIRNSKEKIYCLHYEIKEFVFRLDWDEKQFYLTIEFLSNES